MRTGGALVVGVAIAALLTGCTASDPEPQSSAASAPEYLFVQEGTSGTFAPRDDGYFDLTLASVAARTIYFADRPATDAGSMSTGEFTASFSWAPTPPNAAVVLRDGNDDSDTIAVSIDQPAYDATAGTLHYRAKPLSTIDGTGLLSFDDDLDSTLPGTFDRVVLFIDDGGIPQCGRARVDSSAEILLPDGTGLRLAAVGTGTALQTEGDAPASVTAASAESVTGAIALGTDTSRTLTVAPDACIVTPDGPVPAADLEVGQQIRTRDQLETITSATVVAGSLAAVALTTSGGSGPGGWNVFYLNGVGVFMDSVQP